MDPTLTTLVIGGAALAVGSAAVTAVAAVRIHFAARAMDFRLREIEDLSDQAYRHARTAIAAGREGQEVAVDLIGRLATFHGHDARVTALLSAIDFQRNEAREARETTNAYQEVIVNQGEQIKELRVREMERIEEQELLETELAATKAALDAEAGQADTWARTAQNLGWSPAAAVAAELGAAA